MKALIQRVSQARVDVGEETVGRIDRGLLVLVGVDRWDTPECVGKMARKLLDYRVFSDEEGRMNRSVRQIDGQLLLVSQFTLSADTRKGLRPGFSQAAPPDRGEALFNALVAAIRETYGRVETGRFGANMQVSLVNDGPVTLLLET